MPSLVQQPGSHFICVLPLLSEFLNLSIAFPLPLFATATQDHRHYMAIELLASSVIFLRLYILEGPSRISLSRSSPDRNTT